MESMCAWYGMTRPSRSKPLHGMTSERRVRGAELASVLGYLYPFVEKAARRRSSSKAQTAGRSDENGTKPIKVEHSRSGDALLLEHGRV